MTIGIGAVVSTRFGIRPKKPKEPGVEPAQQLPPAPLVSPPPPPTPPPPPSPPDSKNATE